MFKIGLSTTGKEINSALFENYIKAGITEVEISMNMNSLDNYDFADYKGMKHMSDASGVNLWSFHLPFKPFDEIDISSSDKDMRIRSVKHTGELIKKASDIGINNYVIHSGGIVQRTSQAEVDERIKCACESYAALAEVASNCGGRALVENLPPICVGKDIKEVEKLLSADNRLGICFDTNHLLPATHAEFIQYFGEKIVTMHVSDYDFVNERHWLPGEGKVDWQTVYKALCDINYKGPWLYELPFKSQSTLKRERDLICEDFKINL